MLELGLVVLGELLVLVEEFSMGGDMVALHLLGVSQYLGDILLVVLGFLMSRHWVRLLINFIKGFTINRKRIFY